MSSTIFESAKKSSKVKILYDQEGKATEVMITYELFLEMLSYLPEKDQAYFWTEEWQARESEADRANTQGRFKSFASIDDMLDFLDAR